MNPELTRAMAWLDAHYARVNEATVGYDRQLRAMSEDKRGKLREFSLRTRLELVERGYLYEQEVHGDD